MTSIVPGVPEGGNTITPSVPQISPAKHWVFTYNNATPIQISSIVLKFQLIAKKYYFAEEIGESGTPHLQGVVEFKKKVRPNTALGGHSLHWEKRKGTWDEAVEYCQKDNGDKHFWGFKPRRALKALPCEIMLFPWQQSVMDIVNGEPDDRTIHWIWEPVGNVGKTTFIKWLMRFHEAVPLEGKKNDILHIAAENPSDLYVFDMERSLENFVSYASIEKVKNGCFMSGKYEGKIVNGNCPHLIVFANFAPETEKLSLDRWKILQICDHELVDYVATQPLFNL